MCPEKDGQIVVDMEDEAIRGATVIKDGEITWPPPKPKITAAPPKKAGATPAAPMPKEEEPKKKSALGMLVFIAVAVLALFGLGKVAPADFLAHFTVFVLACFIGYMVIWNVKPSLHTPLMSETNAISGIIVVGALLQIGGPLDGIVFILAIIAILIATINVFGGFLVTQRMLRMFRK